MIVPSKLNQGYEVRVIAPAMSLSIMSEVDLAIAKQRFTEMGLRLSFSKNSFAVGEYEEKVQNKLDDLHEAFKDPKVRMVLCGVGGFDSIELVNQIDYSLIKNNPKIFGGFSDICVLNLAIIQMTGMVTYHCPMFSSFAEKYGFEYTLQNFKQTFLETEIDSLVFKPSETWCSDPYYLGQEDRVFEDNIGPFTIQAGEAEGLLLGGNVSSIRLLFGTDYMPHFDNQPLVLYIEDDSEINKELTGLEFSRNFESIILQPWFKRVKALLIGRFEKSAKLDLDDLKKSLLSKNLNIPIVANLDFGHTTPFFTLPNGLTAKLSTQGTKIGLEVNLK